MIERLGRFIGRVAADVVNIVRNRPQFAPCTVDWSDEYQSHYFGATADKPCCDQCDNGCSTK
jgi:hypothetical protein